MHLTAVDDCADRLRRAGWSAGECSFVAGWLVTGTNGENVIRASGATQAAAWRRACEQAAAVGMLSRPHERAGRWVSGGRNQEPSNE
jgi:hypothetical protein